MTTNGILKWAAMIPKSQIAPIQGGPPPSRSTGIWRNIDYGYPANDFFYGSFLAQLINDKLFIFMNDHKNNTDVTSPSQKVYDLKGTRYSLPFLLVCDLENGTIVRTGLDNDESDDTVNLFAKGVLVGDILYFPTRSFTGSGFSGLAYKIGKIILK